MMLSPNFSLHELAVSQTAIRREIDNTPGEDAIKNLKALCEHILEPLRDIVGAPLLITSGYRSPYLNQAIGGSRTSQHCYGQAADLHCNKYTIEQLFQLVKTSNLPYFQAIQEFSNWLHISYNGQPKRENLRATRASDGHTIYSHD